jgi:hypothetical protein
LPRADGALVDGEGSFKIGIGRYNCDGTYSYYGPGAAPAREGHTDPDRWSAVTVRTTVDADAEGRDRSPVAFADQRNRELACSPFLDSMMVLDWELCTMGLDILSMDTSDNDCSGSFDGTSWTRGGEFVAYAPMAANNSDVIDVIGENFCQLLAFGLIGAGMDCETTERCVPGSTDCPFVKLPDSLCPSTPAEADLFGCHLGDQGNVNEEPGYPATVNCSATAPTTPRDPDTGATDEGQCCDPLGTTASGLPACNAWRILNDFVAAAVEITDDAKSELPPTCQ